jgi:hypothetical protein
VRPFLVATPVGLAACAGVIDLLALAGLHGAFASVIVPAR